MKACKVSIISMSPEIKKNHHYVFLPRVFKLNHPRVPSFTNKVAHCLTAACIFFFLIHRDYEIKWRSTSECETTKREQNTSTSWAPTMCTYYRYDPVPGPGNSSQFRTNTLISWSLRSRQGQLCNLQDPVQMENVALPVQKLLKI